LSAKSGRNGFARPVRQGHDDLRLVDVLRRARAMLDDAEPAAATPLTAAGTRPVDLLQQCLALCERQPAPAPEPVRTLHHFACTGGTVISKCVAAMPNVQMLSEVDPLTAPPGASEKHRFAPTDMPTLLRQSTRGTSEALIAELFHGELAVVHLEATRRGQRLVVRDHAHSHFCRGPAIPDRPTLRELVRAVAPVRSLVTVRHPVDSFASLVTNAWVQFQPQDIDTYCQRYMAFLDAHGDVDVVRFEDFATAPEPTMKRICEVLDLPYFDDFQSLFSVFRLSGDSGRSSDLIALPRRRAEATQLLAEADKSQAYHLLSSRLGYDPVGLLAPAMVQ
jgi:hypothetical protein